MHSSSLFLSATALLAQVASAGYLLFGTHERLEGYGPARIGTAREGGNPLLEPSVGFSSDYANPLAVLDVDSEGDIGSQLFLREAGLGEWALLSTDDGNNPATPADITSPFSLEEHDGILRFVYRGEGAQQLAWAVCGDDDWRIRLVPTSVPMIGDRDCVVTDLSAIPAPQ